MSKALEQKKGHCKPADSMMVSLFGGILITVAFQAELMAKA